MAKAAKKSRDNQSASTSAPDTAPVSTTELDRLIHDRMRLGILSALSVGTSLSFKELKQVLKASDGNLSVHARKLEDAGYIQCQKSFEGRTPRTEYRLTQQGRNALAQYVAHMEAIISQVKVD